MERSNAEWIIGMMKDRDAKTDAERDACDMAIEALSEPIIIHCKGCKFRMKYYGKYCCWLDAADGIVEDYDFCSWAERGEDGEK